MSSDQEKHNALAAVVKERAIAAGKWTDDGFASARHYSAAAKKGLYATGGVWPAFPERFGMTEGEFRAMRKMIYGELT